MKISVVLFTPIHSSLGPSHDPMTWLVCVPWLVERGTPTWLFFLKTYLVVLGSTQLLNSKFNCIKCTTGDLKSTPDHQTLLEKFEIQKVLKIFHFKKKKNYLKKLSKTFHFLN